MPPIDLTQSLDPRLLITLVISGLIGTVIFGAKKIPVQIFHWLKRRLITTVTVDSSCEAYHLLNEWIEDQTFAKRSRSLMLENAKGLFRMITTSNEDEHTSGRTTSWRISMSSGTYLFWYRGTLFFYTKQTTTNPQNKVPTYNSTLIAFSRDRAKVMAILEFCQNLLENSTDAISVYSYNGGWWQMIDRRRVRPLNTIFLAQGQMDRIMADVSWFYRSEEWYAQRGIPYRRAYLFEGPTGTGKTSSIIGLAGHYKKSIYLLPLSSVADDRELMSAITSTPKDCFLVLEDVDCAKASASRDVQIVEAPVSDGPSLAAATPKGITTSGLLNALDGITTPENRLYFMTTNHPDKLDSALLRPGRVDVREHIGKLKAADQIAMAKCFYPDQPFEGLPIDYAPSVLLKVFMAHPHSVEAAQAALRDH